MKRSHLRLGRWHSRFGLAIVLPALTLADEAGTRVCVVEQINRRVFEDDLLKTILD